MHEFEFMGGSMFKNIISMPKTKYLGFGLMIPWEDNLEIQFNLWKDEIILLKDVLEKELDTTITEEDIIDAIKDKNEERRLYKNS